MTEDNPDDYQTRRRQLWPPWRVALLLKMLEQGRTRSQIAAVLGTTKNGIIGKCNRLGRCMPREVVARTDAVRRARLDRRNELARMRKAAAKERRISQPTLPRPVWKPTKFHGEPIMEATAECPVLIMDLTDRTCRWPMWADGERSVYARYYCGRRTIEDCPYCARHFAMSRQRK